MNSSPENGVSNAALLERMGRMQETLDALVQSVNSTNPEAPGLALRMDRLETRQTSLERSWSGAKLIIKSVLGWLFGGGLLSFGATLAFLWRVAVLFSEAGGGS